MALIRDRLEEGSVTGPAGDTVLRANKLAVGPIDLHRHAAPAVVAAVLEMVLLRRHLAQEKIPLAADFATVRTLDRLRADACLGAVTLRYDCGRFLAHGSNSLILYYPPTFQLSQAPREGR